MLDKLFGLASKRILFLSLVHLISNLIVFKDRSKQAQAAERGRALATLLSVFSEDSVTIFWQLCPETFVYLPYHLRIKTEKNIQTSVIMKYIFLIAGSLIINFTFGQSNTQKQSTPKADTTNANPNYDKELAAKLGGDDYGMKSYFLVILKTGANKTTDKELISKSFKGHMNNIHRLVEEGKLIVAGPLGKNESNYRGIFILNNIKTAEDVKELLKTDLAIENGLLDYEIFTWYGSAALPEYLPASDKIWRSKP